MAYGKKYIDEMMKRDKEYILNLLIVCKKKEEKITSLQNRALHLFFKNMAAQLNEAGLDCNIEIQGIVFISKWTGISFKSEIWKPIMKTLYDIESTTLLNTKKINGILDVLTASFAHTDIPVVFPSRWELYLKKIGENGLKF